jgi:hypothetical protein
MRPLRPVLPNSKSNSLRSIYVPRKRLRFRFSVRETEETSSQVKAALSPHLSFYLWASRGSVSGIELEERTRVTPSMMGNFDYPQYAVAQHVLVWRGEGVETDRRQRQLGLVRVPSVSLRIPRIRLYSKAIAISPSSFPPSGVSIETIYPARVQFISGEVPQQSQIGLYGYDRLPPLFAMKKKHRLRLLVLVPEPGGKTCHLEIYCCICGVGPS